MQARFSQLDAQLAAVQERHNQTASQTEVDAQISQVREWLAQEIQAIRQQIQATPNSDGLEALQQSLLRLEEPIAHLQERLTAVEAIQTSGFSELDVEDRLPAIAPQVSEEIAPLPILREPEITDLTTDLEIEIEPQVPDVPADKEPDNLEALALNLGIDFGTSFTKVCFRDVARDRSEIVTFADEMTDLEGVRPLLDTRWLQSIFGKAFEFL